MCAQGEGKRIIGGGVPKTFLGRGLIVLFSPPPSCPPPFLLSRMTREVCSPFLLINLVSGLVYLVLDTRKLRDFEGAWPEREEQAGAPSRSCDFVKF